MGATPSDVLRDALQHMEIALQLLDKIEAPRGTAEYLDLAIHNAAEALNAPAEYHDQRVIQAMRLLDSPWGAF